MNFEVIRSIPEWIQVESEWNALLKHSASHVPFLRHEYLLAWWQGLGGGEWSSAELFIVLARNVQGNLVGIAPLFFTSNLAGERALMLLGSIEISDYLDLIVEPNQAHQFVPALLDFLSGPQVPAWEVLDWYNLLDDSLTLPLLERSARDCDWQYEQTALQRCPHIPLPGDWEQYLAGIDKKQRHEIRRKMRRAEESEKAVRWYTVDRPELLEPEMEDFLSLMAHDVDKEKFLTPSMRVQIKSIARTAFQAGYLQLAFLEVGGEKAAGYLNFDYENRLWVYNSGFDPRFSDLSAGWVLLGHMLQWANLNQRQEFDFMRGDEAYKYRFGAVDRHIVRAVVRR